MKKLFLVMLLVTNLSPVAAQIPVLLFTGHEATEFEFLWSKDIDKQGKFNLFNYTLFVADYNEKQENSSNIWQVITYNINKTWGIATGGAFADGEFLPQIALSYQIEGDDFYLNLFPSVQYLPFDETLGYALFGFLFYEPKINDQWSVFSQLLFEPLFSKEGHVSGFQQIRFGLNYNKLFQFGIGVNLTQTGNSFSNTTNIGVFLRKEL